MVAANPPQFGSKPTASQAENDAAAIGQTVVNKTADGSPQTSPGGGVVAPTISGLSPTTAVIPNVSPLTVNGVRFTTNSKIWFDGVLKTTTFVSSTQLTAPITGGTAGLKNVQVKDGLLSSNVLTFNFTATQEDARRAEQERSSPRQPDVPQRHTQPDVPQRHTLPTQPERKIPDGTRPDQTIERGSDPAARSQSGGHGSFAQGSAGEASRQADSDTRGK